MGHLLVLFVNLLPFSLEPFPYLFHLFWRKHLPWNIINNTSFLILLLEGSETSCISCWGSAWWRWGIEGFSHNLFSLSNRLFLGVVWLLTGSHLQRWPRWNLFQILVHGLVFLMLLELLIFYVNSHMRSCELKVYKWILGGNWLLPIVPVCFFWKVFGKDFRAPFVWPNVWVAPLGLWPSSPTANSPERLET